MNTTWFCGITTPMRHGTLSARQSMAVGGVENAQHIAINEDGTFSVCTDVEFRTFGDFDEAAEFAIADAISTTQWRDQHHNSLKSDDAARSCREVNGNEMKTIWESKLKKQLKFAAASSVWTSLFSKR